jgi:molecular chaperone Hsp33
MAVMDQTSASQRETGTDGVLAFAIADRDCRGRVVRLGPVLASILSAHDYAPAIKELLAEALVLTSVMGSLLKGDGDQLTLQAQTSGGVVSLLVCDYRGGELRGYVQHDAEQLGFLGGRPSLHELFGGGWLAITFDIGKSGQRYQGVVPLEGDSLSAALEAYFVRSEQIPTLIRTAVRVDAEQCIAGGLLVQHLAEGEEGRERLHVRLDHPEWAHVSVMAASVSHEELLDPAIGLETLIWRLYHEEREVRTGRVADVTRGCRCSERHFEDVLARFPSEDRKDMRDESGVILVDCAFCSRQFAIQD